MQYKVSLAKLPYVHKFGPLQGITYVQRQRFTVLILHIGAAITHAHAHG